MYVNRDDGDDGDDEDDEEGSEHLHLLLVDECGFDDEFDVEVDGVDEDDGDGDGVFSFSLLLVLVFVSAFFVLTQRLFDIGSHLILV